MVSRDIIELAISSPIDWEKFESLVVDVLQNDDLPRLRKLGGRADRGIDAEDEAFYQDESRIEAVIQVTSQKDQLEKLVSTISRLIEEEIKFKKLIMVFRQPVESTMRTRLQAKALELGVLADIRDQSYLIAQLSKPGSHIFARYFDDIGAQIKSLLATPDPLQIATDPLRHAVLASLGAYVISPHARMARRTLFEKTILAVIVSIGEAEIASVIDRLRILLPEEQIDEERVRPVLDSLEKASDIKIVGSKIIPNEQTLIAVGKTIALSKAAYEGIRVFVLQSCAKNFRLDDASRGYLERNLRRALLMLLRSYGPIDTDQSNMCLPQEYSGDLQSCFSKDLPEQLARSAFIAFAAYLEDKKNVPYLAIFARTYAALAIRNLDPMGRRWQKTALSRSILALDTDAVLQIIVNESPEHSIILRAIQALQKAGFKIVISDEVFHEAIDHISRADRVYAMFKNNFLRMSPAMADAQIENLVARGYYYALKVNEDITWRNYWRNYYDGKDPERYVRSMLGTVLNVDIQALESIPDEWLPALHEISEYLLTKKEPRRLKAKFRDEDQRHRRVYADVRMAMHLANYETSSSISNAKGYLVSDDRAFLKAQTHRAWSPRQMILIMTHAIPELAAFLCGEIFEDNQIVQLLFDSAIASAATLMENEIMTLTSLGVNLKTISVARLEWDLKNVLHDAIHSYQAAEGGDIKDRFNSAMNVLETAKEKGLQIDATIAQFIESFKAETKGSVELIDENKKLKDIIHRLALSIGKLKKPRRRVSQVLKEIGLTYSDLIADEEDEE